MPALITLLLIGPSQWFPLSDTLPPSKVPRLGMRTPFRGRTLQDVTKQVVSIAKGGLERRGMDEVRGRGRGIDHITIWVIQGGGEGEGKVRTGQEEEGQAWLNGDACGREAQYM